MQNGAGEVARPMRPPVGPEIAARRLLISATLATVALYFVPGSQYLLYPVRLFVTFVHESGHALAATLTGGSAEYIRIRPNTSGVTLTRDTPITAWIVLSAGYLWAAAFGAIMLHIGRLNRWKSAGRTALYFMAGYLLAVTLIWAHNPWASGWFTPLAGIATAAILWAAARYASAPVAAFLASFLAVQCTLDALMDLQTLTYLTSNHLGDNDAVFMSHAVGLPPVFWAIVWVLLSLVMLAVSLLSYWRGTATRHPQRAAA